MKWQTYSERKSPSINTENKINILREMSISSLMLLSYLQKRRIPIDIAECYCLEVIYECNGKKYFAIGFKNNSGGYELRNRYFKGSSSPKDITTLNNAAAGPTVFEGFINFLSFVAPDRTDGSSFKSRASWNDGKKSRVFFEIAVSTVLKVFAKNRPELLKLYVPAKW